MNKLKLLYFKKSLPTYLAFKRLLPTSDSPGAVLLPRLTFVSIVIGVAASILILSLANGLNHNYLERLAESDAHITVVSVGKGIPAYKEIMNKIKLVPGIESVFPFSQNEAIIRSYEETSGIVLKSYPIEFNNDDIFNRYFILKEGIWSFSEPRTIAIGESLSRNLGVYIGEYVDILTYDSTFGAIVYRFKICGIFSAGDALLDRGLGFINFNDASEIFSFENYAPSIGIRVKDKFSPEKYIPLLEEYLPFHFKTWKMANLNTLLALENEKQVIRILLFIFFCVAFFGILAVMTALVMDKREEIALLKALGMTDKENYKSFILTGFYLGLSASTVGILSGLILSLNFNNMIHIIEKIINIFLKYTALILQFDTPKTFRFLNQSVYYLKEFPMKIQIADILFSCIISIMSTLIAAVYPAYLAQHFKPAEILRKRAF